MKTVNSTIEPIAAARQPFHGLAQIVRFNWPFYTAATAVVLVVWVLATRLPLDVPARVAFYAAAGLASFWSISSLVASWLVYDRSNLMTGEWIPAALGGRPAAWITVNAGFDDTTPAVRALFGSNGRVFDIFDPHEMSEPSIARARQSARTAADAEYVDFRRLPVDTGSLDAALLLLSAHELRTDETRAALLTELHRALARHGQIVVAEHLRDLANFCAFGPGFTHFHSRRTWLRAFRRARLTVRREFSITPFVRIFILAAAGEPPVDHAAPAERDDAAAPSRVKWWHGWALLCVLPPGVLLFAPPMLPRWGVMWALAFAIYAGCKWLTWRRTPVDGAPWWRHVAYLAAWPGMDAAAFLSRSTPKSPAVREWISATTYVLCGLALFFGAGRAIAPRQALMIGWTGMTGIVLILHFGLFRLLSCGWRALGVDARPLMDRPAAAVSLAEFWGRRWNTAFRDLTHRFLFRPLRTRLGPRGAIAIGFGFSGLVHELVISVPAAAGYGGPLLFFALQATGLLVERSAIGGRIGLARGGRGWAFTLILLVAPAPLLFHPPFVERIVLPCMRAVGAL